MDHSTHNAHSTSKTRTLGLDSRRQKEMDRCVICWHLSNVPKNTPIFERKHYIQGQGQLCAGCYFELYKQGVFDGKEDT